MAGKAGNGEPNVEQADSDAIRGYLERMEREPFAFDFFQAVRLIEHLHQERPRLGRSRRLRDDYVRFAQIPTMAFPPANIGRYRQGDGERPDRMEVYFFGLFGPNGPLPHHVTDAIYQRLQRDPPDSAFRDFVDIFHHRLLSLFYRAWASSRPDIQFDRPQEDRFRFYVGSLLGAFGPGSGDADVDDARLHFAGYHVTQTRPGEGLVAILESVFQVPVRLVEFVGDWLPVPANREWRLPAYDEPGAATGELGRTTISGSRYWSTQHKFRIVLGPMRMPQYSDLLPHRKGFLTLAGLVRSYVGPVLNWDAQLILDKADVEPLELGVAGELGRTSWICSRPVERHSDATRISPAVT